MGTLAKPRGVLEGNTLTTLNQRLPMRQVSGRDP